MIARMLAAITPVRVAWATVGLVVGVASGAAAASEPITKAPHQCAVMANLAADTFTTYEKQVISVHNQATRGRSEFAEHEADVKAQWAQIDELKAKHAEARDYCLGADR